MFSWLVNQTSFKAERQTNKLLQKLCALSTGVILKHVHTQMLRLSLLLTQGPISGPQLSAQACARGPIWSLRGCERPQGNRRIISLFISQPLTHPCIDTHRSTVCSAAKHMHFSFPHLLFSCYKGLQNSKQRATQSITECKHIKLIYSGEAAELDVVQ